MVLGQIGMESGEYFADLDEAGVRQFAQAIAYTGQEIPPTWLTCLRRGEFELFEKMQIPLASVLHAEQRYAWESAVVMPSRLKYRTRLTQVNEKSSSRGKLTFLVLETEVHAESVRCATARTTIAVKEAASV